jgi:hypothetical protein
LLLLLLFIFGASGNSTSLPIQSPALVSGVISTARFRLVYTDRSRGAAQKLAERIESVRDQFQQVLGRDWPGVTEIRLGVGRKELEGLSVPNQKPPKWAAALAYPELNLVLLDALTLSDERGPTTLRHEMSHVALGQLGASWPRWFQEGIAMYLTGDRFSLSQYASIFQAVRQDRILHFEDLSNDWPDHPADVSTAYAQSVAFVGFLAERHGPSGFGELIDGVGRGEPFEMAFGKAFKTSLWLEERDWRQDLPLRYSWIPILTGGSVLWAVLSLACIALYLQRRAALTRRMREMEAEERLAESRQPQTPITNPEEPPG